MFFREADTKAQRRIYFVLFAIIVLAFVLRVTGFDWGGDGTTYHPDEKKTYWDAMTMARKLSPLSASIQYPAQFTQKILAVLYLIYRGIGRLAGTDWTEIGCVYIARILMAVYGTLAVFIGFHTAESIKKGSGLAAAFVIAAFGPLTAQAHNAVMDEQIGALTLLSVFLGIRFLEADTRKRTLINLALLSAVCAVATLEKWYGGILCCVIILAVAFKKIPVSDSRIKAWILRFVTCGVFSLGCYVITFGIIAPNLLINPQMVYDGIMHMSFGYTHDSPPLLSLCTEFGWFIAYAGILSVGFITFAVVKLISERNRNALLLLIGFIQPAFMAATGRPAHIRWIQPMFMCLLVALGIGLTYVAKAAYSDRNTKHAAAKRAAALALVCITGLNILSNGFLMTVVYAAKDSDTTNISEDYLKSRDIAPENCIYDNYTCIRPAGIGKYYDSVNVGNSFIELDGERYVIKLGRDYALSRDSSVGDLPNIAVFLPDYEFNKCTSHSYDRPSVKWLEPYSIWEAVYYGFGIASGRLSTGMTYRLDDISMIKGVQYFAPSEFVSVGDNYECRLSAVNSGRYEVKLYDNGNGVPDKLPIHIFKSDGQLLAETDVNDGFSILDVDDGGIDLTVSIPIGYAENGLPNIEIKEL